MKRCSFEAGQEGFYWMKYPAAPFKFARDFEGAVGMRREDKCLTNMRNRDCAGTEVQVGSCWKPRCLSCGQASGSLRERKNVGVPGYSALLVTLSWFPRWGERKGTTTPSRLARALLYPPLPNTARAAPWDLTNPLLFQGPRVLAVLLILPAPFFLWLLMLWAHWTPHPKRVLAVLSFWDTLGRFALMVSTFVPAPLPDLREFQYLSAHL